MSKEVSGFVAWIRSFLDDVYAEKGSSGSDLEIELVPKSENSNGILCVTGGELTYDLDKVYPVGSIYMSVNSTNPSTLFGGTWVQLTDTFLYATSTTSDANVTTAPTGQGEATHTLTQSEMPSHSHREANSTVVYNTSSSNRLATSGSGTTVSLATNLNINTNSTGEGQAHNNMPPYMKVYMWKRTQ